MRLRNKLNGSLVRLEILRGRYVLQSIVGNNIVNACITSLATHRHHKP